MEQNKENGIEKHEIIISDASGRPPVSKDSLVNLELEAGGKFQRIREEEGEERERKTEVMEQNKENVFGKHEIVISDASGRPPVSKDSIVSLEFGDPTMYEPFWKGMGDRGTITIRSWQTISYFSDKTNLCWFLEPEFALEIRRLHNLVGNAVTTDRHVIVGTGSSQLLQASVYALSPSDSPDPISVVSAVPYYSSYEPLMNHLRSGLFRWAGDACTFEGDSYIELVCSPRNPDGFLRQAVLKSESGKTIHDLAYFWPQYTPITGPADHDIMIFTFSKSIGHAGSRIGWALVKDHAVAQKMVQFLEISTIGVSKVSQIRAAKILKVVSDSYENPIPGNQDKVFAFGRHLLANRWKKLREVVKASGIFSLPEFPSETCKFTGERAEILPGFAWLKCEKEGIEDCASFLRSHKIIARGGCFFGAEAKYVRVSMLDRDETFDLFIERLSSLR